MTSSINVVFEAAPAAAPRELGYTQHYLFPSEIYCTELVVTLRDEVQYESETEFEYVGVNLMVMPAGIFVTAVNNDGHSVAEVRVELRDGSLRVLSWDNTQVMNDPRIHELAAVPFHETRAI